MKFWLSSKDSSQNLRKLTSLRKTLLLKLKNIDFRDYCEHISTSDIGHLRIV